ncbi:hypothetical protein PPM_3193 [Paenibacillus polymyxa M1]|nr:hypothetical protein PPM_3193 [Paenibacillus polymyxa M1]
MNKYTPYFKPSEQVCCVKNGYISVYIRKNMKMKAIFNDFQLKNSLNFHNVFGKYSLNVTFFIDFIIRLNMYEEIA